MFGLVIGVVLAAAEAGAVDLSHAHGFGYERAYLVFLVMSGASIAGGAIDAATSRRWSIERRLATYSILFTMGGLLVATRINIPVVALGLVLVGLPTAALLGIRSHRFDALPTAARGPALTVAMAAQSLGFALGAAGLSYLGQPGVLTAGCIAFGVISPLTVADSRKV